MATEAETSRDERSPSGGSLYDGFISYSHAADGLLAPRLQAGLQRFAKPWWKRRALRIFRDESSLSANPHLWGSITDALDASDWFVLLLSPEAADSEWVNNEIGYWLKTKDADRIIPVVTDGTFQWAGADIVPGSTAAPPALRGAFRGDPRWVDLRHCQFEEDLDLGNASFRAAIADIASAMRGVPKDELESEEVRQNRRTIRTAVTAGVALLVLAIIAGVAAVYALDQRNATAEQRDLAQQRQAEAEAAAVAEAEAREEAVRSALVARSNELLLRAEKEIPVDPERAMLLAIEAIELARRAGVEPIEATRPLRTALASSRIVHRLDMSSAFGGFVAASPDGALLATRSGDAAGLWDIDSWEQIALFSQPGGFPVHAAFSPSGDRLAVAFETDADSGVSPAMVYDIASGSQIALDGDPNPFGTFPQVAFAAGGGAIASKRFDAESDSFGTGLWSSTTGEFLRLLDDGLGPLAVDPRGERVATIPADRSRMHDIATGATLWDLPGGATYVSVAFSPSGTRLAEASQDLRTLRIRDAASGDVLLEAEVGRIAGIAWLDEERIAVGGEGAPRVVDADTGETLLELAGHADTAWELDTIPGTDWLATASFDGFALVWDVTAQGLPELPSIETGLPGLVFHWPGPDGSVVVRQGTDTGDSLWVLPADGSAPKHVIGSLNDFPTYSQDGSHNAFVRTDGSSGIVAVPSGEVVYTAPEGLEALGVNNDASLVVLAEPLDLAISDEQVPVVVDTATGRQVAELTPPLDSNYFISPDSTFVTHTCCGAPNASVYRLPGGEPTGPIGSFGNFFSGSGAMLAVSREEAGVVWLIDTELLKETGDVDAAAVATIRAHAGSIFGVFSPDETMMATSTFDEPIKVWDITGVLDGVEPRLIAEIDAEPRLGPPSTTFSPDGRHIVARSTDGVLIRFTIDTDELIALARARLTRGLTSDECATFGIDPCPPS